MGCCDVLSKYVVPSACEAVLDAVLPEVGCLLEIATDCARADAAATPAAAKYALG